MNYSMIYYRYQFLRSFVPSFLRFFRLQQFTFQRSKVQKFQDSEIPSFQDSKSLECQHFRTVNLAKISSFKVSRFKTFKSTQFQFPECLISETSNLQTVEILTISNSDISNNLVHALSKTFKIRYSQIPQIIWVRNVLVFSCMFKYFCIK